MAGISSITTVLSVRLPNDVYEDLQKIVVEEQVELSDLIRRLLTEALDARKRRVKREAKR